LVQLVAFRHCGLDPQSPNPKNNQEIAGQARNDAVGKYRHLINGMTLVFSLYSSDITSKGKQCVLIVSFYFYTYNPECALQREIVRAYPPLEGAGGGFLQPSSECLLLRDTK
jgi:hypothetical protein